MILKKLFPLALVVLLAVLLVGCNFATPKEIDVVYVSYRDETGRIGYEQKVDLKEKQLWKYSSTAYDPNRIVPSGPMAENEGFVFVRDLDDDKIASFRREAERYGFANWADEYINPNVCDGDRWDIAIGFSDGTTKTVVGSNAYPTTWDKMFMAFEKLAGERILLFESDYYGY